MQHRAASRSSVAFGILFTLAAMALSFLAVLAVSGRTQDASAAQAQYNQASAAETGCANTSEVRTFTGTQNQTTEPFRITGDRFRLAYNTEGAGKLEVAVLDEQGQRTGESFEARGNGSEIIPLGPGTFKLEIRERAGNVSRYSITVEDCLGAAANNNNNTTPVTTAQITTAQTTAQTTPTTTAETTTAETATADDVNRDADAFRCELFLREVGDVRIGQRGQYQDAFTVRRIEQCLVLADTIPDRRLPGTGGVSLLGLAAIGLASLVAGASVLGAVLRRRR